MLLYKFKRKAYTLVEILVAAAIFSALAVGVFSLFSMGSRMYICGSWKYTKQKEGERFLQILKERIEQASIPAYITHNSASDTYSIEKSGDTAFFVNKNGVVDCTSAAFSEVDLANFVVAKTDTSASEAASTTHGLILYHRLYVKPDDGLGKLCLYADQDSVNFSPKSSGIYNFPPSNPNSHVFGTDTEPYSFPNGAHEYNLEDIASITFNGLFYENDAASTTPVFGLTVTMKNRKYPDTQVELKMRARIDKSLRIQEF